MEAHLLLGVESLNTLLQVGVQVDDPAGDGIVGHFVAVVHQDEEQVKPENKNNYLQSNRYEVKPAHQGCRHLNV